MLGLQELLLNFLFLIIFLLFTPIILELNFKKFSMKQKRWIYTISSSLAIISCMSFPITVMDGYIFDLRLVALTIGGLYGGIQSIVVLGGVTVLARFVIGGIGAPATLIVVILSIVLLITMYNTYNKSSRSKKVIIGTTLSVSAAAIALLNSTFIFNADLSGWFIFIYILITLFSTALLIFLYEVFNESILINKRVLKAEKMEVVSHLASSVSHEVRNPLTVVRGFLQLMIQTDLPKNQRDDYLKMSIDEIDRANEIIKDYLTFAKPSPENEKTLSIKEELQRVINLISPFANMNGVEIETEINDYYIKGEEQIFQQCLLNITKNCIEAMPNSGKLTIQTKRDNSNLILMISDNGKGMTKEQISRLGEPYFTTKGREGTGLGMMVAMNIIVSMNGDLSVESEINNGTNFYIRLPLDEKNKVNP